MSGTVRVHVHVHVHTCTSLCLHARTHTHTHMHTCIRPGRYIAMDCEMVGGGQKHCEYSMLARCSIVNNHGNVIYDKYVKPMDTIVNFRTRYSGITPKDLRNGEEIIISYNYNN